MESGQIAAPLTTDQATLNYKQLSRWRVRVSTAAIVISIAWLSLFHRPNVMLSDVIDPWNVACYSVLIFGLLFRSWAAAVVCKREILATTGPYALCRHPLYFGSMLMLLAFCGLVRNILVGIFLPTVLLSMLAIAIKAEEQFLANKFLGAWESYAAKTPRIGIRVSRIFSAVKEKVSAKRWWSNREIRVWIATSVGLAALEIWQRWLVH